MSRGAAQPLSKRIIGGFRNAAKWVVRPKTVFLNGFFTRFVVRHYCRGRGCEIGPGVNPQTDLRRTFYIDKYRKYGSLPILVDVVGDASNLPIRTGALDYLFSSHVLEHCPDTIATLNEWTRVLKSEGLLVLRLPHKERTFDKLRPVTPLSHHVDDFNNHVDYYDQTHMEEFLELAVKNFDFNWLPAATLPDASIDRDFILRHGHIHHHVWTQNEIVDLLRYLELEVLFVMDRLLDRQDSFLVVCRKH